MTDRNLIHPAAIVSDKADIGEGTGIGALTQVCGDARIGKNCVIGSNVYIGAGAIIGDGCRIENGASIYQGVTLENDVFVGPNVVFTNDLHPRAFNEKFKLSRTLVKRGASIGANATILCRNKLGEYCMVGAGSVVTGEVPPHSIVCGNPARPKGMVCRCGRSMSDEQRVCERCGFTMPNGIKYYKR